MEQGTGLSMFFWLMWNPLGFSVGIGELEIAGLFFGLGLTIGESSLHIPSAQARCTVCLRFNIRLRHARRNCV